MDFVTFEAFADSDDLPSPQPSLMLPSTSNLKKLSAKINNFKEIKSLLEQNWKQSTEEETAQDSLADKYAGLSLSALNDPASRSEHVAPAEAKPDKMVSDALSLRLSRALNPSVSDTRIRELFTVFDSRLADNALIINSGVEGSLARKHMRSSIEIDLIEFHTSKLSAYTEPISRLRLMGEQVRSLQEVLRETNEIIDKDDKSTTIMRNLLSQLDKKKGLLCLQKDLLSTFREKFVLSEYDAFVLDSREINSEFFEALKRAEQIHEACSVLLALDDPSLGNKFMAKSSSILKQSREKIMSFCRKYFKGTIQFSNREQLTKFHLCLRHMNPDSEQLRLLLNELTSSRAAAVLEEFNSQISGQEHEEPTSHQDASRPLYYSSHDPIRFITDMLAFSHSSAANESELVSVLLDYDGRFTSMKSDVVSAVMSSLATPIRSKLKELITFESKLSTLCQILSILDLYFVMFEKHAEAQAIASAVTHGIEMIRGKINVLLTNRLSVSEGSNSSKLDFSSDLQPPQWMTDYYSEMFIMLDSINSMTLFGDSGEEIKEFSRLLLDRPIGVFEKHLKSIPTLFNEHEKILFRLNVFDLVISKMTPFSILSELVSNANRSINDLAADLEEHQFKALISNCALTDHYNVMNMICPVDLEFADASVYEAVSESKIFKKDTILAINESILAAIPVAILESQQDLSKLNNPVIVNKILATSSLKFSTFYDLFVEVISLHVDGSLLAWSAQEVATLLGVEYRNP